jgi:hypothetical protein
MAANALGGRPLPFNIPTGIDALKARDATFWQAHAAWREAETAFETWPEFPDECPHAKALFDRASDLWDRMIETPIRTAAALAMKLEAVRETCGGDFSIEFESGLKTADIIEADVGRIAKGEIWGAEAFQDMAEG